MGGSISQPGIGAPYVDEKLGYTLRDHNLTACSVNDPAQATTTFTPEAGKPAYTKVFCRRETNWANAKVAVATAASEQIANGYLAVYNQTGERLGASADVAQSKFRSTGTQTIELTADSGKSLVVAPGADVYVWVMILVGTQGSTALTLRTGTANSSAPNFNLAAGASLRCGTTGTGKTSPPASLNPAELTVAAGPILIGA